MAYAWRFTPPQDHIDYLSLQALLYKRATMSLGKQVMTILAHSKRLADLD